jgi:hypothetical protein
MEPLVAVPQECPNAQAQIHREGEQAQQYNQQCNRHGFSLLQHRGGIIATRSQAL